jgi:hypothetical protein
VPDRRGSGPFVLGSRLGSGDLTATELCCVCRVGVASRGVCRVTCVCVWMGVVVVELWAVGMCRKEVCVQIWCAFKRRVSVPGIVVSFAEGISSGASEMSVCVGPRTYCGPGDRLGLGYLQRCGCIF